MNEIVTQLKVEKEKKKKIRKKLIVKFKRDFDTRPFTNTTLKLFATGRQTNKHWKTKN